MSKGCEEMGKRGVLALAWCIGGGRRAAGGGGMRDEGTGRVRRSSRASIERIKRNSTREIWDSDGLGYELD